MKKRLLVLFLIVSHFSFSQSDVNGKLKTEIIVKRELGYVLHTPKNGKDKKPLIIFIPGDGEKGTDLERVKIHGPFKYLKTHDLDAYVLAPQCLENENWDIESIYQLILKVKKENNIDYTRIYLTGLSSGGWVTWNLGITHPELFAALVPISAYVDLYQMDYICNIKMIPTQIYHGLLDDVVQVNFAISAYKALKACDASANVKLTIFDDSGHDSWSRVYDTQAIYNWMFQQIKKS